METYFYLGVEVQAIQFDGEKWLYEKKKAYPMVESRCFIDGNGLFGFSYGPVLLGNKDMINDKDWIVCLEKSYIIVSDDYFGKFFFKETYVFTNMFEIYLRILELRFRFRNLKIKLNKILKGFKLVG